MSTRVITGRTQDAHHVRPMDDAAIYRSMYGTSLPYAVFRGEGGQFYATLNEYVASVRTGVLQMQGYAVRLDANTSVTGTSIAAGYKRMDIIAMQYSLETVDQEEYATASIILVQGSPQSYSVDVLNDKTKWAQLTEGDIDSGETHQIPLWGVYHAKTSGGTTYHQLVDLRVLTSNVNLATLNAAVTANTSAISTLKSSVSSLTSKINGINDNARHIAGNSFTAHAYCAGHITSSSKQIYFFIPTKPITGTISITELSIGVRHVEGGFVYVKKQAAVAPTSAPASQGTIKLEYSDSSGNIIKNGSWQSDYLDADNCAYYRRDGGIAVKIVVKPQFTTKEFWQLATGAAYSTGKSKNPVKNNTPIAVTAQVKCTVS